MNPRCLQCGCSRCDYKVDPKTNLTLKENGYCRDCYERLAYLAAKKHMSDRCDTHEAEAEIVY